MKCQVHQLFPEWKCVYFHQPWPSHDQLAFHYTFVLFFILHLMSCTPEFPQAIWLNYLKTVLADGAENGLVACKSAHTVCHEPHFMMFLMSNQKSITENISFDAMFTGRVFQYRSKNYTEKRKKKKRKQENYLMKILAFLLIILPNLIFSNEVIFPNLCQPWQAFHRHFHTKTKHPHTMRVKSMLYGSGTCDRESVFQYLKHIL